MSRRARVIPVLLDKGSGLTKTRKFQPGVYVGDAINAVRIFNEKEADELILLDIQASKVGRGPNFERIRDIASECFMPLAYGGGVRSREDALTLIQCGVEKVILNRAFREDPSLVTRIAEATGASSVVVSIDAQRSLFGKWQAFAHETGKSTGVPVAEALERAQACGAGEVMINAVARDGTRQGPDLGLVNELAGRARVPLIYCGGIASLADMQAVLDAGASACAVGAMFVLHGKHEAVLISYPSEQDIDRLRYPACASRI